MTSQYVSHHQSAKWLVFLRRMLVVLVFHIFVYGISFVVLKRIGEDMEASVPPLMSPNLQAHLSMQSTKRGKLFSEVIQIFDSAYTHSDDPDLRELAMVCGRGYKSLLILFGDHPIDRGGPGSYMEVLEDLESVLAHPIEGVKLLGQMAEMLIRKTEYKRIEQRVSERYKIELAEFNQKVSAAQQSKAFPLKVGVPLMFLINLVLIRRIKNAVLHGLR